MKVIIIVIIDNIDFTFYTKNQNHEMLENTVIPLNAKTNNQEINVIFDNVEQLKKEAASEDIKTNKNLNKNPETEINEFNEMGIEKILSNRKSKEFINLIEKENNNLNNGTDNANKTNFPSAKFTFHNESSIINNKTVFTQENTFSEVKKDKTEVSSKKVCFHLIRLMKAHISKISTLIDSFQKMIYKRRISSY